MLTWLNINLCNGVKVLFPPRPPFLWHPHPVWMITALFPVYPFQNFLSHLPVFLFPNTNTYFSFLPFFT